MGVKTAILASEVQWKRQRMLASTIYIYWNLVAKLTGIGYLWEREQYLIMYFRVAELKSRRAPTI